ncbi:uncharacterized protein LOC133917800 [Phragmites australis]|uniref:uncharacterized protein LOC133917800 n=1 Tax=Phragmites australis TaxID=29695 RepID=UPI002D79F5E4|nr:uncharacterized protein LOC133917800 [Phragmites australis]
MPEFDAQGLVDRPGRRNPGTIQIPRVDEEAGSRQQADGRDTTDSMQPPKEPVGGQRQLEELRLAPALGPSTPVSEPSVPAGPEPRAPASPEPRAPAGPEQPALIEPTSSTPRTERVAAGEVVALRAMLAQQPSRTPSASAERARRGPSPRPPSGQAPEPLPEVLGSAREVIGRLEVAVAAERAELDKELTALVEEWRQLKESKRKVAEEREALEETRDEAVAVQEKASCMERLMIERDQASWRRVAELLAWERQLLSREEAADKREEAVRSAQANLARENNELEHSRADVLCRQEQVELCETDVEITTVALDAREEQIMRREEDAASVSSALTAREELVTKREAEWPPESRPLWPGPSSCIELKPRPRPRGASLPA